MRLHECICTPIRVCIYMYMHTYTQTHIYTYTYICTCTYTCIHAHTYAHTCTCALIHWQKISTTTPRRIKQYSMIDAQTNPYTDAFIDTYICIYTYAHNLQRMCCRCACWCQRNICTTHTAAHALVPRTPVLKCTQHQLQNNAHMHVLAYTYAYAYICTRIHMRIYDTVQTCWRMASETQNLCTNMYTHTHTHEYTCMCISIHIHMQIFTYMHVHTHIHTYKYTRTYNVYIFTHASMPGTTALQRLRKELMQTPEAPHVSFVRRNQPYLAPPMLGLYCTK